MFEVGKKLSILYEMSFLYRYLGMKTLFIILLSFGLAYASEEEFDDGIKQITTCNCGWLNRRNFEMIEGDKSGRNKYPMVASIRDIRENKGICSGVIMTQKHILTLSCCAASYKNKLDQIGVYIGQSIYKPEELCLLYDVEKIEIQANFALLVLKEELRFTRLTGPACSPKSDFRIDVEIQRYTTKNRNYTDSELHEGKLVGWELEGPDYRRSHHVPVSINECRDTKKNNMYCTETYEGYNLREGNTCMKQPGSPLLWFDNEIFRYTVVGLLANPGDCNHLRFFKVDEAIKWIEKTIDSDYKLCVKQDMDYGDFKDTKEE